MLLAVDFFSSNAEAMIRVFILFCWRELDAKVASKSVFCYPKTPTVFKYHEAIADLQPHVRFERADEATSDQADAALVELLSFLDTEVTAEQPQKKKQKTASAASLFE